jgi:hypothetical protein
MAAGRQTGAPPLRFFGAPGTRVEAKSGSMEYDFRHPSQGGEFMKRFTWLVLLVALAIPAAAGAQATEEKRFQIPVENSPSQGPADAPVTIVEFLDFQ